jgi:hypothetical protein
LINCTEPGNDTALPQTVLQLLAALLRAQKLLPGLAPKGDDMLYPGHIFRFLLLLLLSYEKRLFLEAELVVNSVVELVHLVAGAVRVVPDKLLWLVELTVLEEVASLGVDWMRQEGVQVVILQSRIGWVFHDQ